MSTPSGSTAIARGNTRPSRSTWLASIAPSPFVSSSTTTRPTGASSPWPARFGMKPRISTA
jgi:hypothetical protein